MVDVIDRLHLRVALLGDRVEGHLAHAERTTGCSEPPGSASCVEPRTVLVMGQDRQAQLMSRTGITERLET
jgi:hypothetical protein